MMVNMRLITDDKRFTPTRMCQYRRCIAHCTAGHKERSLFTETFCSHFLQAIHGRVFAIHIISKLGTIHSLTHSW